MSERIYDVAMYEDQILAEGRVFDCQICGLLRPESDMRMQSGLRVGFRCCYEPEGGTIERDIDRANATALAASLAARSEQPLQFPGTHGGENVAAVTEISPSPINLSRGGAAAPVILTGVGFIVGVAVTFSHAGITHATPLVINSTVQLTLSIQASGGMPTGSHDLIFTINSDTEPSVFRGVITVRQ